MDIMLERILDCIGIGHGSAKALADALGINPQIITNWKCGQSKSYRKYLPQIAEYYGLPVEYFTGEKEKPAAQSSEPRDPLIAELVSYAEGADEDGVRMLIEMAKRLKDSRRD